MSWLPAPVEELFGPDATAEESYDVLTVDVPPAAWLTALETARTTLTCTYFDWLSAVDEPGTGFRVSAHVVALHPVRRLLVRTTVPHEAPVLPSAVGVYAGAAWHERETHEMFGVDFTGHPALDHLLLPENFEGHPLRKDFVLAARVAKAWPGAKEPGESEHGGPKRRQMLPPGVPDPNEWGPLKGQLPPAPSRPARAAAAGERPARRARAAGEPGGGAAEEAVRPRRARSASEGSASQGAPEPEGAAAGPRRMRSASEGSASQAAREPGAAAPRRTRSASEGSVSQSSAEPGAGASPRRMRSASQGSAGQGSPEGVQAPAETPTEAPRGPRRSRSASQGSASQRTGTPEPAEPSVPAGPTESSEPSGPSGPAEPAQPTEPKKPAEPARRRSADAPWHHARPAFEEADERPKTPPAPEQEPTDTPDDPAGGAQ
ncbi:NADH-quinone oxidoreductase subunit C [Streptomyces griseoluteus]|uniref:NADH-quinone oxidoreductase subunit C n=1 Tax=Streptomyces griseoluteus TaxID=29306 RepID=A0A4Z1DRC7_STRGP|nr:NADH-quinone oxidoreductase subunit C [Streptomyces griseoluteus]TGN86962.1 NADH-quinone oxidoreductase subunit C [Streptomyces griseoluteus]GHF30073.1 dehydrogenase [Streptomyces griseoluteus]